MKFINTASDCTIKTFISARFDNRIEALTIEGNPSKEDLSKALEDIETEFNDLSGNIPAELVLFNKINKLNARITAVNLFFASLDEIVRRIFEPLPDGLLLSSEADVYLDKPIIAVKNVLAELKRLGVSIKWTKDMQEFKKSIKNAKTKEISKEVDLDELSFELSQTKKLSTKYEEYTKKDFYKLLHAVQNLGFKVSEHETNMFSYGIMCSDYFALAKKTNPN